GDPLHEAADDIAVAVDEGGWRQVFGRGLLRLHARRLRPRRFFFLTGCGRFGAGVTASGGESAGWARPPRPRMTNKPNTSPREASFRIQQTGVPGLRMCLH